MKSESSPPPVYRKIEALPPTAPSPTTGTAVGGTLTPTGASIQAGGAGLPTAQRTVQLSFETTRDQVFKAFPATANLADKAQGGKIRIDVSAGFESNSLRNAVLELLDEANIERKT
jgi:hypothetical protein